MASALRATCVARSDKLNIESTHPSTKCSRTLRMNRIERTIISLKETVQCRLDDKSVLCKMNQHAETWNIISEHANYIRDLYLELGRMGDDESI